MLELTWLQIPSHRVLDLELLLLLIEFSAEDVEVNGVDDEILEFPDSVYLQLLQQHRVG